MALLGAEKDGYPLPSLLLVLGTALHVHARRPAFDEYQVKAAILYNFAKFVEWPPGTFANSHGPIGICIVGQSPFVFRDSWGPQC